MENGGFVRSQHKVSETKSAVVSYLNAAVMLHFPHLVWKLLLAVFFLKRGRKEKHNLVCWSVYKVNNLNQDVQYVEIVFIKCPMNHRNSGFKMAAAAFTNMATTQAILQRMS